MESNLPVHVENSTNELIILEIITESDPASTSKTDIQAQDNIKVAANQGCSSTEAVFTQNFAVAMEAFETSNNSRAFHASDLKCNDTIILTEDTPVLIDTDGSNIIPLDKILGSNVSGITPGQSELHSTMSDFMETNDNEHQVHEAVAPLYNCNKPDHEDCENNAEMLATTHDRSTNEAQNSEANCKDKKLNPQDEYTTDHRYGRHLKNIYVPDVGNKWYDVKGNLVTRPIDPKKLPNAFGYLPIYGRPTSKANLADFQNEKIREFIGFDINDQEFENLAQYCRYILCTLPFYCLYPNAKYIIVTPYYL